MYLRRAVPELAFVLLLVGAPARSQNPVVLRIKRSEVLPFNMRVKAAGPFRSGATRQPSGLVWSQEVPLPGGETGGSVRVHVRVLHAPTPTLRWEIRIKEPAGQEIERVPHTSSLVKAGDFWSDEVPSRSALIELHSDADPVGLQIQVDEYAFLIEPSIPQAITGVDQRVPIGQAPAKVRDCSGPVARLRFIVDGEGQAVCTGFLVSRDLLMTNHHCISTASEARSAVADFRYDTAGSLPRRFRVATLEATDTDLDYSVLRLQGDPSSQGRLRFAVSAPQAESQRLFIIQHPAGEPKQASVVDCIVSGVKRSGVSATESDFGHLCDTLGGSSGSPVFDWETLRVVGLHHLGFRAGIDDPVNQAVQVQLIRADLRRKKPNIANEVWNPSP